MLIKKDFFNSECLGGIFCKWNIFIVEILDSIKELYLPVWNVIPWNDVTVRIDLIQVEYSNKMYLLACRWVVSSKGFILFRWLDGSGSEAPPHQMVRTCSRADKHCVTGVLACWSFGVGVNVYTATNTKPINELVDFDGVFLMPSQRHLGILCFWQ